MEVPQQLEDASTADLHEAQRALRQGTPSDIVGHGWGLGAEGSALLDAQIHKALAKRGGPIQYELPPEAKKELSR